MCWKSLIATGLIINSVCCAVPLKPVATATAEDLPASRPAPVVLNGMQEIDPESPPMEGVWMTWEDAYAMATYMRQQRVDYETKLELEKKSSTIAKQHADLLEKQLLDDNSPAKKWWLTWGFPIGLGIGTILGVVVPIAITAGGLK